MAQDFVGSNNINLLVPSGQFGTRLTGGDDAASPRYIFTCLAPIARYLFPEVDDVLLNYREDDGQLIEPDFYCPIIPLLLVNGSQGIGTGWSTFIPPYNPVDVLNYIRAKLDKEPELPPIHPFARGFQGTIEPRKDGEGYVTVGRASKKTENTVLIDELPLRCWTNTYKTTLLKMRDKGVISSFLENHTTTKVSFTVTLKSPQLQRMERTGLESVFKLQTNLLTSNMHAFDANHIMRKYESPEAIADDFFPVRMRLYEDRKSVLESEMNYSALLSRNKAKFIQAVTAGEIDLMSGRKSKTETASKLEELGFAKSSELKAIRNDNEPYRRNKLLTIAEDENNESEDIDGSEFDYLLSMPLSSLTSEKIAALHLEASKKEEELEVTKATSAADLWRQDLEKLASHL
jgi:DNA topoisomerase II